MTELAQYRIYYWTLISTALQLGIIIAEVQNIVVFVVGYYWLLFMVYLTRISVARFT